MSGTDLKKQQQKNMKGHETYKRLFHSAWSKENKSENLTSSTKGDFFW